MNADAVISDCGRYRYRLTRSWGQGPRATFVMLNPSTADAEMDDPTIRRCIGFARAWGLDGITVINLYALRASKPAALLGSSDPCGPDNHMWCAAGIAEAGNGGILVAAWGAWPTAARNRPRATQIPALAARQLVPLLCLGVTKNGSPRHPLYVPADTAPISWPIDVLGAVELAS